MNTEVTKNLPVTSKKVTAISVLMPVQDYKILKVPGMSNASKGVCYVRVTDIPGVFDQFLEVNPRVPSRSRKNVLSGPVVKGILSTLRDHPEEMSLKNQGIYLLVGQSEYVKRNDKLLLRLQLTDASKHGIINGGHTYAAIREAVETATEEELESLKQAYVQLHIFQGIEKSLVADIAEGLNRSKQVDDISLANLQGEFDLIRKTMSGKPGSDSISYHQGDNGEYYVADILAYIYLFDMHRFDEDHGPNQLYNRQSNGLKYFKEDLDTNKRHLDALIKKLPDFLKLSDMIRKSVPESAKRNKFKFGMTKIGNVRAAAQDTKLPFLGDSMEYRVPNGWVYPMLSAFRANLKETKDGTQVEWIVPIEELLPKVIDSLVGVCIAEHKNYGLRPDAIGKRESAYNQCYSKVQLYLARKGLV